MTYKSYIMKLHNCIFFHNYNEPKLIFKRIDIEDEIWGTKCIASIKSWISYVTLLGIITS